MLKRQGWSRSLDDLPKGPDLRFFVPVFFRAPLGGVHANVAFQSRFLRGLNHEVTVMCPPGPFADALRAEGTTVLVDSMEDVQAAAARAALAGPFDVVHAHPFRAREIGLEVARQLCVPFFLTIHGMYSDDLRKYAREVSLVFSVSDAIRDYLISEKIVSGAKVVTVCNGVDTKMFTPELAVSTPQGQKDQYSILLPTRLDQDKRFILDVILETWEHQGRTRTNLWKWMVAGAGTADAEMRAAGEDLSRALGYEAVEFLGWQNETQLADLYRRADVCVAPGRCCLEGLASGTPAIALGSQSYDGVVSPETWRECAYGNFGGFGQQMDAYTKGRLFSDLESVLYDDSERERLARFGRQLATQHYDQEIIDAALNRYYEVFRYAKSATRALGREHEFSYHGPQIPSLDGSAMRVEGPIFRPNRKGLKLQTDDDDLLVQIGALGDASVYLSTGAGAFRSPPSEPELQIEPSTRFAVDLQVKALDESCPAKLWALGFDGVERAFSYNRPLRLGSNRLEFTSTETSKSLRLAFSFSGTGSARLGRMILRQFSENRRPLSEHSTGSSTSPPYEGENLLFVFGAPRSGTTWMLKLLEEHPDIVAADVDNLSVRVNDKETLETNVFNPSRPFSDLGIWKKFAVLSSKHAGKVIVEKTPIHLLHASRIRRIFPKAKMLLVLRDGRAAVASLMEVGRSPSSWWRGAPAEVTDATKMWRKYAEAALEERARCTTIRYEDLLDAPEAKLRELLQELGLDVTRVEDQVARSAGGRNISIPGVFSKGERDGWKKQLSAAEQAKFDELAGDLNHELGYTERSLASQIYSGSKDVRATLEALFRDLPGRPKGGPS